MSEKIREEALVVSQKSAAPGVWDLWIQTERIAEKARAGQFLSLYCRDASRLLPRPISICEINREEGWIRLMYRVAGKGTEEFSGLKAGDRITVLGPLGNGFPLEDGKERNGKALLVGGGIGIPPMLELAKERDGENQIVAGYANDDLFLYEDLKRQGRLWVSTDDGSFGVHGTVADAIREADLHADVIFACGPKPMLRAVKEFAQENAVTCWLSLEERMACGIGACLGCVCKTVNVDEHSKVHNARICKDGPVFNAREVDLS